MTVLDDQLGQLRDRFGEGVIDRPLSGGTVLVTVPRVSLPEGWNKPVTSVRFVVPAGYPFANLDCFWADADLRLMGDRIPQAAAVNAIPDLGEMGLWFSWHLTQGWNPSRDTLSSWMNTINDRLRRTQ